MMTIPRTRLLIDAALLSSLIITVTSLLFAFSWLNVILYFEWPYDTWRVYVERHTAPRNLTSILIPTNSPNLT
jgi:hypothetical protein